MIKNIVVGGAVNTDNQLVRVVKAIELAKQTEGWVNNFTHWHSVVRNHHQDIYKQYLDLLASNNNNDICFCSYGEAIAYCAWYSLIDSCYVLDADDDDKKKHILVKLNVHTDSTINPQLLQVPVSLKIRFTKKTGGAVKCNYPMLALNNREMIVEVPFSISPIVDIYESKQDG